MTDRDYTHLQFVVDRSGSMVTIASDMEGAVRQLLKDQRELPGKLTVGFVRFDDEVEEMTTFADAEDVDPTLSPRNRTALYDAMGTTINKLGDRLAGLPEDVRPGKVLFVIVTDGLENASRDFTAAEVKTMVERQTNEFAWEFVYLGANQDAVMVAKDMGIAAKSALTYDPSQVAVAAAAVSDYTTRTRSYQEAAFTDDDRRKAGRA